MILSSELLGQLQSDYWTDDSDHQDSFVIIESVASKKKQKILHKQQKLNQPNEEVKQFVKKLSKKKQKRVEQIQKRKERDLKQNDYIAIIKKNELDETKRDLLTSSRQLNQQLSMKQLLSLLLKKEKAGIKLSEEELNVLYKSRGEIGEDDIPLDAPTHSSIRSVPSTPTELKENSTSTSPVFSFDEFLRLPVSSGEAGPQSTSTDLPENAPPQPQKMQNKKRKHEILQNYEVANILVEMNSEDFNEEEGTLQIPHHSGTHLLETDSEEIGQISLEEKESSSICLKRNRLTNPIKRCKKRKPLRIFSSKHYQEKLRIDKPEGKAAEGIPKRLRGSNSKKADTNASTGKKSLGTLLLDKFKKLKDKNEEKSDHSTVSSTDDLILKGGNYCDESNGKPVKTFAEMKIPIDLFGRVEVQPSTEDYQTTASNESRGKYSVTRPQEIRSARINLPVCQMEQEIIEAVTQNDVIILCGETGSGKSTQVPQFLYEYGYSEHGMIGIAQPRRVAVISTSERVNYEMGQDKLPEAQRIIGYQVRYDSHTISSNTKIKFMTDGILLREITQDILLRQYSVVILDEAHERNVNTDILLGMLSRAIPLRRQISLEEHRVHAAIAETEKSEYQSPLKPLKLIIMSATLRINDFQTPVLFPQTIPPVISVPSRQYPVTTHFAKRTEIKDYLQEVYRKVVQIHTKLPGGGILVFLTGKQEILGMCRRLYQRFYGKTSSQEDIGKTKSNKRKQASYVPQQQEEDNLLDVIHEEVITENKEEEQRKLTQFRQEETLEDYFHGGDGEEGELDYEEVGDEDLAEGTEGEEDKNSDDEYSVTDPLHPDYNRHPAGGFHVSPSIEVSNTTEQSQEDEVRKMMLAKLLGKDYQPSQSHGAPLPATPATDSANIKLSESAPPVELKPLIYPLYAMMSPKLQERVFRPVPEGYRLIVIATNVAETSITIPNISYVVDSGRCKEKVIVAESNGSAGITKYEINWISKASADQRQGRAGRTGPGHCYRLYSANFYHQYMKDFLPPEITVTPLEDVVLQMAALGIKEIYRFPFPTNPPKSLISNAINLLQTLGALERPLSSSSSDLSSSSSQLPNYLQFIQDKGKDPHSLAKAALKNNQETQVGVLSTIGKAMSFFPIHPRFSKIIVVAIYNIFLMRMKEVKRNVDEEREVLQVFVRFMGFILTLVATLAEKSIFTHHDSSLSEKSSQDEDDSDDNDANDDERDHLEQDKKKPKIDTGKSLKLHSTGDALALLRGAGAYAYQVQLELASLGSDKADPTINKRSLQRLIRSSTSKSSKELEKFCQLFQLHQATLHRVLDLRCQLQQIAQQLLPKLSFMLLFNLDTTIEKEDFQSLITSFSFPSPSSPPTTEEETILRQLLLAGYSDQIAKKIPIGMVKSGNRRDRFTGYMSCHPMFYTQQMILNQQQRQRLQKKQSAQAALIQNTKTDEVIVPIYFHPHSNLYPSDPLLKLPEYVIYHTIVMNQSQTKYYMTNVTVIEESWITMIAKDSPLLSYSEILSSPLPYYDSKDDTIYCYVNPKYGNPQMSQAWELSTVRKPMIEILQKKLGSLFPKLISHPASSSVAAGLIGYRKEDEIYRWFAKFLLEGNVFSFFKDIAQKEQWKEIIHQSLQQNKVHPKISMILKQLVLHQIYSRAKLLNYLQAQDPSFLLHEIVDLIKQPSLQAECKLRWKELTLRSM